MLKKKPEAKALLNDAAIANASASDQRLLRILREVIDPPPPADLKTITTNQAWLSDVRWDEASVGWGQVARNYFWFDEKFQNGVFLKLTGEYFDKGLYAHSPSKYVFALDGQWKTFSSIIGLREGAALQGSAIFRVMGDGKELHRSRALHASSRERVEIDITGVKKLELLTEGAEGHNHNSWAIWADAAVER